MNIELPLYRQEKRNTCALACLRMVLAAYGTHVEESVLERHAHMEINGVLIEEVERLARQWHLVAEIQETTVADLRRLLAEDKLVIAFLDRKVFDLTPAQRARHSIHDDCAVRGAAPARATGVSEGLEISLDFRGHQFAALLEECIIIMRVVV